MNKKLKKLVISYSDDDRDVALNVTETLQKLGYEVWIAHKNTKGIVLWTQAILDAIDDADGIVLLWSATAEKSKDVHEEIRIARVFRKPIFPVVARPMNRVPPLPDEIRSLQVIHEGNFDSIIVDLKARLSDHDRSKIDYPERVENGHIPRGPNPYFVGRNRELKGLFVDTLGFHGETKKPIPIAISGLAGIGKTHLALTFAYRFNLCFSDGVYWVDTSNGVVQEFEKVGNHLGIIRHNEERPLDYATRVYARLCQLEKGLIIFDNVDDIPEFRKWCPVGNKSCSVILTTRKSPRGFAVRVMNLAELDADSAYELIISRRKDRNEISHDNEQKQAIKRICDILGKHPLALEVCATHLQAGSLKPMEFLRTLERDVFSTLPSGEQADNFIGGEYDVYKLLKLSYNRLDRERLDPYFFLLCWFEHQGINDDLIINAYGKPDEGKKAIDELVENSLIYSGSSKSVSLHPLISEFGKYLQQTERTGRQDIFVEVIAAFLKANRANLQSAQVRSELPQVFKAIETAEKYQFWRPAMQLQEYCADIVAGMDQRINLLKRALQIIQNYLQTDKRKSPNLYIRLGKAYKTKGQLKDALEAFDQARVGYDELPEFDFGEIASLQFELGDIYLALGQYDEARRRLDRALDIAKNRAGYDVITPEVTRIRQALANINLILGNYDSAETSFNEVLSHREKFRASHPDAESNAAVGSSYADLSRLALASGNYKEAIIQAEKALVIIEEHLQDDDPAYGNLLLLLGAIYYESGDYKLAEEHIESAQRIFSQTFGENHPSYARTLLVLGDMNRKLGKFVPALEKIEVAINIFENRYGETHPSVAEALNIKGKIYDHLCEFGKEETVWKRILSIQSKVFSENHPELATTHYNYGNLCLRRGEFDEALKHLEESLRITEKSFGKTHPEYFGRLIRLATCHYEQQKYAQADEQLREAHSLWKDIFGESPHPYIARLYQLQSEVDRRSANFEKALASIDQAIAMKEAIYGKDHPSVAEALEVKVKVFHHLGDFAQAEPLLARTLKIRKASYGETHPEVGRSEHDWGSYYLRLGQYDDAISHFEKALRISESIFGKFHLEYIERGLYLANAHNEKGQHNSALKQVQELDDVINRTIPSENHYLKARWLIGTAEIHRRLGHFKEALDYANRATDMRVAIYGDVHPSVAKALECQGKIYDHLCEFGKEETVWKRVFDIQLKIFSENHPELAATHYNYGNLCLRRGEFDEALKHLEESLRITEKSFGKTHPEYFGRLILLATCHYEQQKYAQADEQLKEAHSLWKFIFKESPHPYIARMSQLQSEIDRRSANFEKALASIDQAIAMKEAIYGKDHPSVAEALEVKVKVFHHLGDFAQAEPLLARTLKIRKASYGETHPEVGRSEHDWGSYYLRLGQYDDAISHFEKALRISESISGKFRPEYIERALHLAKALYEKEQYSSALKQVQELDDVINRTIPSENHYLKARWLLMAAEIHSRLGHFKEALDYANRATDMRVAIYGDVHPSVAEVLECQGKIYDHLCEFDKEEVVLKRILAIQLKIFSENHPELAATHYNYGNLCLQRGEFDEALKHLEESLRITEKTLGKTHPEYFGRLIQLATCHYEQQKYAQADEQLREAHSLRKDVFGESPHRYIARMSQLQSEIDRRSANFEKALASIDQAIAMKEAIYGKDHPSVAEALEIKVDLNLAQYQTCESKELLDRIERIQKEAYGERHPAFSNYQMRLAEYHSITGDYEKAQEILEKSIQTCNDIFAAGHPEIIKRQVKSAHLAGISSDIATAEKRINEAKEALNSRLQIEKSLTVAEVLKESALIKRKRGDFNGSLAELEEALKIETTILEADSPGVIETLIYKVKLLIVFHRLKEAELVIESAMSMVEGKGPIYKRLKADLLDQRGILETHRKNFDQAIKSFDEAINLKRQVLDETSAELAKLLIDKAVALRDCARYNDSLALLQEAQNINNPLFNEDHVFFARICLEMGLTYHLKKIHAAAVEQLTEALEIYRAHPKQDLREHANALESMGLIYLETGPASKAYKLFGDAMEIKRSIYDSQHPEIAKTLHHEARALLNLASAGESSGKFRESARQKLEEASQILKSFGENGTELMEIIENTKSQL